ncbi:MAG: hypothetical protein ABIR80_11985, partial [Opitutaceae bacterium]
SPRPTLHPKTSLLTGGAGRRIFNVSQADPLNKTTSSAGFAAVNGKSRGAQSGPEPMNRSIPGLLMALGLVAGTDVASGQSTATVPDVVRVAIQDLIAEPSDYGRQKPAAERLPRLKGDAAPPVTALIKVLRQPVVRVGSGQCPSSYPRYPSNPW